MTVVVSGSTVTLDFEPGTATATVDLPVPLPELELDESTTPGTVVLEHEYAPEVTVLIPSHTVSVEVEGPGDAAPVTVEENA